VSPQGLLGIKDTPLTTRFKAKRMALDSIYEQSTMEEKVDEKVDEKIDEKDLTGAKKSSNGF
jgi:hypothetical protein